MSNWSMFLSPTHECIFDSFYKPSLSFYEITLLNLCSQMLFLLTQLILTYRKTSFPCSPYTFFPLMRYAFTLR